MRLIYPWILVLFPISVLLGLVAIGLLRRGNQRLSKFATPSILQRVGIAVKGRSENGSVRYRATPIIQIVLFTTGLALLVIAAARPQWGKAEMKVSSRGRNLLIALDVSRSMLADRKSVV